MSLNPADVVKLSGPETDHLVQALAACPFVGSAVSEGRLAVRNSADKPLASIEDVRKLGDSGGGDLGEVLALFASGNHAAMRGEDDKLDTPAPAGLFSLEFPGSQGAHPGHSGILMGDPETLGSGRLNEAAFARLTALAVDGLVKRSDVARFIAENLIDDPKAKVFGRKVAEELGVDFIGLGAAIVPALLDQLLGVDGPTGRSFAEKLTNLTGEDNLIGSSGEFGLLFAFLSNRPGAKPVDGEPTVSVEDLESMFVSKRLPAGFESWSKTRDDWVRNTIHLALGAAREYLQLTRES
jgi:hypothetical protein